LKKAVRVVVCQRYWDWNRDYDEMLGSKERGRLELFVSGSLRQLVPDGHILARVDRMLDLSCLREEVDRLYRELLQQPLAAPDHGALRRFSLGHRLPTASLRRMKPAPQTIKPANIIASINVPQ
jgi:hypothetical protein